jgi:hypothetical protein
MKAAKGDSGGEDLDMKRGHYGAWIHVAMSVFWVLMFSGLMIFAALGYLLGFLAASQSVSDAGPWLAASCAVLIVAWCYWDRWKCIEAFSSRFCSGNAAFSLGYVPFIAGLYAIYRGFRKFVRK